MGHCPVSILALKSRWIVRFRRFGNLMIDGRELLYLTLPPLKGVGFSAAPLVAGYAAGALPATRTNGLGFPQS